MLMSLFINRFISRQKLVNVTCCKRLQFTAPLQTYLISQWAPCRGRDSKVGAQRQHYV